MIKSVKKINELSALLEKDNSVLITGAIGLLRSEQPFEGAIGLLTSFYDRTEDVSLRKLIEEFMNDLKDQAASSEVITEIMKRWKPGTTTMLVASCWQSGLDYSEYSPDMANIFINGDYFTALECLTVIEESADKLTKSKKNALIKILKTSQDSLSNEKKILALELIALLSV